MTDIALRGAEMAATEVPSRAKVLQRLRLSDAIFHGVTRTAAIAVLLLLGGVIFSLVAGSLPALRAYGFDFITTEVWNPVTDRFGALAPIYGTLVTSLIAMCIAVPIGLLAKASRRPLKRVKVSSVARASKRVKAAEKVL